MSVFCRINSTLLLLVILFQPKFLKAQRLEIQYLANEGVLIKAENFNIIIDGVFKREFDYLDVLSDEEQVKIEKAKYPYESIDLILATHFHGDHFNAQLVGNHLLTNSNCRFLGPGETITDFKNKFEKFNLISNRVTVVTPNIYDSQIVNLKNIEIKVLRFEHFGESPWKEAENVAYLLSFGEKKILHFGDSKIDKQSLDKFTLDIDKIDLVVVPYWMATSPQQKEIIEKYIAPRKIWVAHIPLERYANAQKIINDLGYKNATALVQQFMMLEDE